MIHSAKETKSEAQNPKFETISKLQIQTFQTSFLISFICSVLVQACSLNQNILVQSRTIEPAKA